MYFTHSKSHGRKILGKRGKKYKADASEYLRNQNLIGLNIDGRLSVSIIFHPPSTAKMDIDNYLKAPIDSLSDCGFWLDDSQIDELKIVRSNKVKDGILRFDVRVIDS